SGLTGYARPVAYGAFVNALRQHPRVYFCCHVNLACAAALRAGVIKFSHSTFLSLVGVLRSRIFRSNPSTFRQASTISSRGIDRFFQSLKVLRDTPDRRAISSWLICCAFISTKSRLTTRCALGGILLGR